MRRFILKIAPLALLGTAMPAAAQDFGYMDMGASYITVGINGAMMDAATGSAGKSSSEEEASAPPQKVNRQSLGYTPSLTRRRENFADFVAKTKKVDPAGAKMLADILASGDVIEMVGAGIRQYGLRTDNFADAYTLYWISAWQAANKDYRDISRETAQAVKAQAEDAILTTEEFQTIDDAEKQKLAEAYIIQGAQIGSAQEFAKTDRSFEAKLATAVTTGATKSGFDLAAVTLTDDGFVAAKGRR